MKESVNHYDELRVQHGVRITGLRPGQTVQVWNWWDSQRIPPGWRPSPKQCLKLRVDPHALLGTGGGGTRAQTACNTTQLLCQRRAADTNECRGL